MHLGSVSVVHLEMEEETTGNLTSFLKNMLVKQKTQSFEEIQTKKYQI